MNNENLEYTRKDILKCLEFLNTIVVSLDKIGSAGADKSINEQRELLDTFCSDWNVYEKLAYIRKVLSSEFSDELGVDDMDELERELQNVPYWDLNSKKP